ncbi:hypothetical protein ACWDE0_23140 [Streptomyces sp. 900105755]
MASCRARISPSRRRSTRQQVRRYHGHVRPGDRRARSVSILDDNARNSTLDPTENLPGDDFDTGIATRLKGTYPGTKAALNHVKTSGGWVIINLGSVETFATTRGNAH